MLLDRGLLERSGSVYRMTGPVKTRSAQSLHGLIAARRMGPPGSSPRPPGRRRGRQDLQRALPRRGERHVPVDVQPLLTELVRKEVLSVQADPRSPERGQYGFLQDLVKRVADETFPGATGKKSILPSPHGLSAPGAGRRTMSSRWSLPITSRPTTSRPRIPTQMRSSSCRGRPVPGRRTRSVTDRHVGGRAVLRIRQPRLVPDSARQAEMHERAGQMAARGGRNVSAIAHLERAVSLYESENLPHPAARALSRLGLVESVSGQLDGSIQRMERAYAVLADDAPDEDLATLAVRLASLLHFKGNPPTRQASESRILTLARSWDCPKSSRKLYNIKAMLAMQRRHDTEAMALYAHALQLRS